MTAKQYVDEIKLRLSRLNITLELDDDSIMTFVNMARREVQQSTLPLYPERYGRRATVTGFTTVANLSQDDVEVKKANLPTDCIDVVVCLMKVGTRLYEARRFNKKELYRLTTQAWNKPTVSSPAYAIERNPEESTTSLLVATKAGTTFTADLWYTAALPVLELLDNTYTPTTDIDKRISWEFRELVVINAMIDCLQKVQAKDALGSVKAELDMLMSLVQDTYTTTKQKAGVLLPSRQPLP